METAFAFMSWVSLGFLLGIQHAFEADHIVAVSTLASEQKSIKKAPLLGIWWGLGHSASILGLGTFVLITKITIPQQIAEKIEMAVGFLLIILGIRLWHMIHKDKLHRHEHRHDGTHHIHLHSHRHSSAHEHAHFKKSFGIGILHGAAGSAAITILLLTKANTIWTGLFYLIAFGIGSIVSMAIVSTVLSIPFILNSRFHSFQKTLQTIAGMLSIAIGIQLVIPA